MLKWSFRVLQQCRVKYLMIVIVALTLSTGCSSETDVLTDTSDEDEIDYSIKPEEPEPWVPSWSDGYITVEVGQLQTGAEILNEFSTREVGSEPWRIKKYLTDGMVIDANKGGMWGTSTAEELSKPDFPMAKRRYTIKVAIVSMLDAGLDKPVTIDKIVNRYRELGYRPLTMEEAMMFRLRFSDQPSVKSGHELSSFYILPSDSEEDQQFLEEGSYSKIPPQNIAWRPESDGQKKLVGTIVYKVESTDRSLEIYRIGTMPDRLYYPVKTPHALEAAALKITKFAGVIIE